METKNLYVKNMTSISYYFWLAGFMFSMGIGALPQSQEAWYEIVINFLLNFLTWPLLLGRHFAQ